MYNFFGKTLHNHLKKYNRKLFCCKTSNVNEFPCKTAYIHVSYILQQNKHFEPKIAKWNIFNWQG